MAAEGRADSEPRGGGLHRPELFLRRLRPMVLPERTAAGVRGPRLHAVGVLARRARSAGHAHRTGVRSRRRGVDRRGRRHDPGRRAGSRTRGRPRSDDALRAARRRRPAGRSTTISWPRSSRARRARSPSCGSRTAASGCGSGESIPATSLCPSDSTRVRASPVPRTCRARGISRRLERQSRLDSRAGFSKRVLSRQGRCERYDAPRLRTSSDGLNVSRRSEGSLARRSPARTGRRAMNADQSPPDTTSSENRTARMSSVASEPLVVPGHQHQGLGAVESGRDRHASARSELREQRGGDEIGRRRDENPVERRVLGPSGGAVAGPHLDIVAPLLGEPPRRAGRQLLDDLDAVDPGGQGGTAPRPGSRARCRRRALGRSGRTSSRSVIRATM